MANKEVDPEIAKIPTGVFSLRAISKELIQLNTEFFEQLRSGQYQIQVFSHELSNPTEVVAKCLTRLWLKDDDGPDGPKKLLNGVQLVAFVVGDQRLFDLTARLNFIKDAFQNVRLRSISDVPLPSQQKGEKDTPEASIGRRQRTANLLRETGISGINLVQADRKIRLLSPETVRVGVTYQHQSIALDKITFEAAIELLKQTSHGDRDRVLNTLKLLDPKRTQLYQVYERHADEPEKQYQIKFNVSQVVDGERTITTITPSSAVLVHSMPKIDFKQLTERKVVKPKDRHVFDKLKDLNVFGLHYLEGVVIDDKQSKS